MTLVAPVRTSLLDPQHAVVAVVHGGYGMVPAGATLALIRVGDMVVDPAGTVTPHQPDLPIPVQSFAAAGRMTLRTTETRS